MKHISCEFLIAEAGRQMGTCGFISFLFVLNIYNVQNIPVSSQNGRKGPGFQRLDRITQGNVLWERIQK
jgi:hypothetical protein